MDTSIKKPWNFFYLNDPPRPTYLEPWATQEVVSSTQNKNEIRVVVETVEETVAVDAAMICISVRTSE